MKPFDLKAALAGEPVVTRNGCEVSQLIHFQLENNSAPVRFVCKDVILACSDKGRYNVYSEVEHFYDLFMAPKKRTVWINLFSCLPDAGRFNGRYYESEQAADYASHGMRIGNRAYPIEIEE